MDLRRRSAHFLARHRRDGWNRAVAKACRTYLNAFDNLDYHSETNGEVALVQRMSWPAGSTVFDVGANMGSWSAAVRADHPGSVVHAFEIDPVIADRLAGRFAGDGGVTVVPLGLSDRSGVVSFHRSQRSTRGGSIIARPDAGDDVTVLDVEVRGGDDYLAGVDLDRVRFVKVDTEGNDLNVLRGFAEALQAGRIDALQFEHNELAVAAGVHLKDFYDLLDPFHYDIGRLFPDCVLFRPWLASYEREAPGNHVAVLRDRSELRSQLAGAAR